MKSENSRLVKNTLFLYLRTIVVLVVSLYTSRVVLKSLGVEDYGIYNVVGGLVSMFVFINGAMSAATMRFLTIELGRNDKDRLNVVFSTSVFVHIAIAVIVVLLAETAGLWFFYHKMVIPADRMTAAWIVFQVSVLTASVSIMNVPYNSLLIAHERMSLFAYITILDAVLKLAVALCISYYTYDRLILYSFLLLAVFLTIIAIYRYSCLRLFPESKVRMVKDWTLIVEMSRFAGWNLFSNFSFVTYTQGLNVLLNVFFGPAVNAARGVAFQVETAVSKFVGSFQSALNPQITKSYAMNDRDRLFFLIETGSRYSFYLILMLIFPLFVSIDYILSLWLEEVPAHTSNFIRLTFLVMPISVLTNSLNIATQATGRVKRFFFITGSMKLLILPLSYVALLMGGPPETVYMVNFVFSFLTSFVYIYVTCSEVSLSMWLYLKKVVVRAYGVAFCGAVIPMVYNLYVVHLSPFARSLEGAGTFWGAMLNMAVAELSILGSVFLFGMTASERNNIYRIVKRYI